MHCINTPAIFRIFQISYFLGAVNTVICLRWVWIACARPASISWADHVPRTGGFWRALPAPLSLLQCTRQIWFLDDSRSLAAGFWSPAASHFCTSSHHQSQVAVITDIHLSPPDCLALSALCSFRNPHFIFILALNSRWAFQVLLSISWPWGGECSRYFVCLSHWVFS